MVVVWIGQVRIDDYLRLGIWGIYTLVANKHYFSLEPGTESRPPSGKDIDCCHKPEDTGFLKLCQYHSEDSLPVAQYLTG